MQSFWGFFDFWKVLSGHFFWQVIPNRRLFNFHNMRLDILNVGFAPCRLTNPFTSYILFSRALTAIVLLFTFWNFVDVRSSFCANNRRGKQRVPQGILTDYFRHFVLFGNTKLHFKSINRIIVSRVIHVFGNSDILVLVPQIFGNRQTTVSEGLFDV